MTGDSYLPPASCHKIEKSCAVDQILLEIAASYPAYDDLQKIFKPKIGNRKKKSIHVNYISGSHNKNIKEVTGREKHIRNQDCYIVQRILYLNIMEPIRVLENRNAAMENNSYTNLQNATNPSIVYFLQSHSYNLPFYKKKDGSAENHRITTKHGTNRALGKI
jgi:hypothetical protein